MLGIDTYVFGYQESIASTLNTQNNLFNINLAIFQKKINDI